MNEKGLQNGWHDLTEDYAARDPTHESDIFPTISGLTGIFRPSEVFLFGRILREDTLAGPLLDRCIRQHSNLRTIP